MMGANSPVTAPPKPIFEFWLAQFALGHQRGPLNQNTLSFRGFSSQSVDACTKSFSKNANRANANCVRKKNCDFFFATHRHARCDTPKSAEKILPCQNCHLKYLLHDFVKGNAVVNFSKRIYSNHSIPSANFGLPEGAWEKELTHTSGSVVSILSILLYGSDNHQKFLFLK